MTFHIDNKYHIAKVIQYREQLINKIDKQKPQRGIAIWCNAESEVWLTGVSDHKIIHVKYVIVSIMYFTHLF